MASPPSLEVYTDGSLAPRRDIEVSKGLCTETGQKLALTTQRAHNDGFKPMPDPKAQTLQRTFDPQFAHFPNSNELLTCFVLVSGIQAKSDYELGGKFAHVGHGSFFSSANNADLCEGNRLLHDLRQAVTSMGRPDWSP